MTQPQFHLMRVEITGVYVPGWGSMDLKARVYPPAWGRDVKTVVGRRDYRRWLRRHQSDWRYPHGVKERA